MTRARLLIVDDEVDITTVMKRSLEMAGFYVAVESDPIEAFKNFRPDMYDLVLLDIRMPDIDGIELYRKMREIDKKFKVCFISTFIGGEYGKLGQQYSELVDNNCFIEKPVTMTKLEQIVKSQLGIPQK
jgi:two-component system catabolic regulation response regulator CreB/two-component system response regulator ChvI